MKSESYFLISLFAIFTAITTVFQLQFPGSINSGAWNVSRVWQEEMFCS